jgi:carboxymethylenebutenolidase
MGKNITLKASDGHEFTAYRADPAGKPKGSIIVIQEIFGVNDHIRSVADRVAANGYIAVAPALQDRGERNFEVGYTAPDVERGRAVRGMVKNEDSMKDLVATFNYLKAGNAGKIGTVGYCWGGSLAWLAATEIDGLAMAVSYYGGEVANNADKKAKCPVMFHFGAKDMSIPMEKIEIVKQKLGAEHPVYVYEDAGHGFSCDARASFHPASHELALTRTRDFAAKHMA